jgi:ABC-2 type transport system permease protein
VACRPEGLLDERQPAGGDIWTALAWCAGILIAAYLFAVTVYRRKIA